MFARPQTHERIAALDGVRGLAIILVLLNHLRLTQIVSALPDRLQWLGPILTSNGKTGVSLLFLLSGYLLATYYPQVRSTWSFWQKRYTRIFPPLVALCLSLTIIRFYWKTLPLLSIPLIILVITAGGGLVWRWLQAQPFRTNLARSIFFAFFGFQVAVAAAYVWWFPSVVPPAVFYQVWQPWLQRVAILLVNGTLTLPLGTYIEQLDGAYWSLTTELFFYLLYPLLVVPLVQLVKQQSPLRRSLFAASGLLLLYGADLLSARALGLGIMNMNFFIYFLAGVLVAHATRLRDWIKRTYQRASFINRSLISLLILGATFGNILIYFFVDKSLHSIVQMAAVIPSAALLLLVLTAQEWINAFSQKQLVFVGTISYSLYITHTIAIEMFVRAGEPESFTIAVAFAIASAVMAFALATWVNHWLEKPYFRKDVGVVRNQKPSPAFLSQGQWWTVRLAGLSVVSWWLLWLGSRPAVGLSAVIAPLFTPQLPSRLSLTGEPLTIPFTARDNQLGMLTFHFVHQPITPDLKVINGDDSPTEIVTQIKDANNAILTTTRHRVLEVRDSRFDPIGLPLQANSAGQAYTASVWIEHPQIGQGAELVTDESVANTIYFPGKKAFLSPRFLITHLWSTLFEPLWYFQGRAIASLFAPFFVITGATLWEQRKRLGLMKT